MTSPTRTVIPLVTAAVMALAACSSPSHATTNAAAASSPASSPTPATPLDAAQVLAHLVAANIGVTNGQVQDVNTDPNNIMGRPHQYTSRASFDLPGGDTTAKAGEIDRGGSIEVFATAEDAKTRYDYVEKISKSSPLFTEYHYLNGTVVVRVTKGVKPDEAAKVAAAVKALKV